MPVEVNQNSRLAKVESSLTSGNSDVFNSSKMAGIIAKIAQPKIMGAKGERRLVEGAFKKMAF